MSCGLLPISEEALSVSMSHTLFSIAEIRISPHFLPLLSLSLFCTYVRQVGKVSYYEGRKPLAGHKEKKEFAKALGKNKVRKLLARSRVNLRFLGKKQGKTCAYR